MTIRQPKAIEAILGFTLLWQNNITSNACDPRQQQQMIIVLGPITSPVISPEVRRDLTQLAGICPRQYCLATVTAQFKHKNFPGSAWIFASMISCPISLF
jgi:hypothetical protein